MSAPRIDIVFLDIGGVIYEDRWYANAIRTALRELGAEFTDEEYASEYDACRSAQAGSFRTRLTERFLGPGADINSVVARAAAHWAYPPEALHDDVHPCLDRLKHEGYRVGVIANQQSTVRATMERDGIAQAIDIWAISDDVGIDKPDPGLFQYALREADVDPARAVMCGDRLDYDIEPAKGLGMRTVWVLRGEAPRHPTPQQLQVPDASVPSLDELPDAFEEERNRRGGAG